MHFKIIRSIINKNKYSKRIIKVKNIFRILLGKCKICFKILKNNSMILKQNKLISHKIKAYNKMNLEKQMLNKFNMMKK